MSLNAQTISNNITLLYRLRYNHISNLLYNHTNLKFYSVRNACKYKNNLIIILLSKKVFSS